MYTNVIENRPDSKRPCLSYPHLHPLNVSFLSSPVYVWKNATKRPQTVYYYGLEVGLLVDLVPWPINNNKQ